MSLLSKDEIDAITTVAWDSSQNSVLMLDFEASEVDKPALSWQFLTQNQLGEWLINMNREASAILAGGEENLPERVKYSWDRNDSLESPLQLIKLVGHYIYNSVCPAWFFSSQKIFCDSMINYAVQQLDGYEEA
jgi:hypothetical protein